MACAPCPGDLYRHHRGTLYRVAATGRLDGRGTEAVVLDAIDPLDRERRIVALPDFAAARPAGQGDTQPRFARVAMPTGDAFERRTGNDALPADLIGPAMARYADPHRFYHATWHVHDLFRRAAQAHLALSPAQALAIVFHDVVYVPGAEAGANERMSALLLRQWGQAHPPAEIDAACRIIEDTAHHRPGSIESEQITALDLAGLGDPAVNFDAYTEMAWLEHRHLFAGRPDAKLEFLRRRHRVLAGLAAGTAALAMPAGFHAAFAANLERLGAQAGG